MYAVTKRIEFCYGHRLLEHGGACRHLHGHNAVAEVEVQSPTLDAMNMVTDFGEITQRLEGWILREIDHRMLLRQDDPMVPVLEAQGEPMYLLDSNPTAERLARLLFDVAREHGLAVSRVTLWENSSSWATYHA
jgi:6-pyruvoyltetrahydropterin/6-carboxytetrahydropterin synthase